MGEIEELLKKAREKLKSKKLIEALGLYNEVIKKDENNFSANYDLGIIYLILKDYELAAGYFEKARALNPEDKDTDRYFTLTKGRIRKQFEKPMTVQIETTSFCNAQCLICPNKDMKRKKGVMDDALFKKIVDDCKEIQPLEIYPFITGEPFMDKEIIDRIKYINKALPNTKVKIFTNGALLNHEVIKKLLGLKIDGIVISFNGATKETYEKQMGLNYEKTIENIKLLSQQDKIPLLISMVITKDTLPEINKFMDMWKGINIKPYISSFKNYGGKLKIDVRLPVPEQCGRVLTQMTVLHDGRVSLCCMDNEGEVILGDARENSLMQIWNSDKAKEIRKLHMDGRKEEIMICKDCTSA